MKILNSLRALFAAIFRPVEPPFEDGHAHDTVESLFDKQW